MATANNNTIKRLFFTLGLAMMLSACQAIPNKQHQGTVYDEYLNGGDMLPIEAITTIDGEVVNLQQLGKRKLVIFFATWCSDSNRLMKALNSSPLIGNENIDIIAIAREEDKETVKNWRDKRSIKIALAVDSDRSLYKRFASAGIPRVITVGENNKIIKMNLAEDELPLEKIVWQ